MCDFSDDPGDVFRFHTYAWVAVHEGGSNGALRVDHKGGGVGNVEGFVPRWRIQPFRLVDRREERRYGQSKAEAVGELVVLVMKDREAQSVLPRRGLGIR